MNYVRPNDSCVDFYDLGQSVQKFSP